MREPRRDEPTEIFGSYLLFECLGRGGMATVHRAVKTGIEGFERPVALKRMLPWLTADPDYVKSFVREARLAAQLRHVNITQTYDLGKVDDTYFIAMELVPGRDLREILRVCHTTVGPMPTAATINVLFQLCDALDYAHTFRDDQGRPLGLVHRDISPANVIIADDGTAKLVDFGVAKGTTATLATASGLLKGKFAYMAPEMLQGQVDARADLFAVGVCAWELLTARPLFAGGDDMEILQRVSAWDPPPPSSFNPACPRELDAWVAMALTKPPQRRFQSAAQMRAGLELVARTPALRASTSDVAGWIAWAFAQPEGVAPAIATAPAPVPSPSTVVVEEVAIVGEVARTRTAIGTPAAPARPRTASQPVAPTVMPARTVAPSQPPPPIAAARTLIVDDTAANRADVAEHAAAAARTVLLDHGSEPVPVPMPPAPSQAYPGAHAIPQLGHPAAAAMATQHMVLPAPPPHAEVPLSSMVPTLAPGHLVQPAAPVPAWSMQPRAPEATDVPASAAARGTPGPYPVVEPRPSRPRSVAPPPARPSSRLGLVIVLVLCAAAAVAGFFLVQHLG